MNEDIGEKHEKTNQTNWIIVSPPKGNNQVVLIFLSFTQAK
mgnify:CR=1 FL=1